MIEERVRVSFAIRCMHGWIIPLCTHGSTKVLFVSTASMKKSFTTYLQWETPSCDRSKTRKLSDQGSDMGPLGAAFVATDAGTDAAPAEANTEVVASSSTWASPLPWTALVSSIASRLDCRDVILEQSNTNKNSDRYDKFAKWRHKKFLLRWPITKRSNMGNK